MVQRHVAVQLAQADIQIRVLGAGRQAEDRLHPAVVPGAGRRKGGPLADLILIEGFASVLVEPNGGHKAVDPKGQHGLVAALGIVERPLEGAAGRSQQRGAGISQGRIASLGGGQIEVKGQLCGTSGV